MSFGKYNCEEDIIQNISDDEDIKMETMVRRKSTGLKRFPPPRVPRPFRSDSADGEEFKDCEEGRADDVHASLRSSRDSDGQAFKPKSLSRQSTTNSLRSSRDLGDAENTRKCSWMTLSNDNDERESNDSRQADSWNAARPTESRKVDRDELSRQPEVSFVPEQDDDVIEIDVLKWNKKRDEVEEAKKIPAAKRTPPRRPHKSQKSLAAPAVLFGDSAEDAAGRKVVLSRKSGRYDEEDEASTAPAPVTEWDRVFAKDYVSSIPFAMKAHSRGQFHDLVRCHIVRDRSTPQSQLYPTYELYLDEPRKLIAVAMKMSLNRTSNYHLFDMCRGQAGTKLTKKSGNYMGKLRAQNSQRTVYSLVTRNSEKEEIAGIVFENVSTLNYLKEGSQPRKMFVAVPHLDSDKVPISNKIKDSGEGSLTKIIQHNLMTNRALCLHTKEPVLEGGSYRLNFRGRVTVPSVKNFQLVSPENIDNIVCQFGKVGEDKFNLDFKAPLNPVQAFSFALCQFNL